MQSQLLWIHHLHLAPVKIGTLVDDLTEQVRYGEITPEDAASQVFEEGSEILAEKANADNLNIGD